MSECVRQRAPDGAGIHHQARQPAAASRADRTGVAPGDVATALSAGGQVERNVVEQENALGPKEEGDSGHWEASGH